MTKPDTTTKDTDNLTNAATDQNGAVVYVAGCDGNFYGIKIPAQSLEKLAKFGVRKTLGLN
ncbi:MAG: hypothetical protein PHX43_07695 [Alphaproteobacteria bacterium]|nr:hypothetical protein [Alphaproteobacteria bacterium]